MWRNSLHYLDAALDLTNENGGWGGVAQIDGEREKKTHTKRGEGGRGPPSLFSVWEIEFKHEPKTFSSFFESIEDVKFTF